MMLPDCADGGPCRCERLETAIAALVKADRLDLAPVPAAAAPAKTGDPTMEPWLGRPAALIRVAHHEAAHAAVGVLLEGSIQGTGLAVDGRGWVVTRLLVPPGEVDVAWLVGRMVVFAAGHAADLRRGVRHWQASAVDIEAVDRFAEAVAPRCLRGRLKARVLDLAREVVADFAPAIDRIADALLRAPFKLDGPQVEALCGGLEGWANYHKAEVDSLADELTAALALVPTAEPDDAGPLVQLGVSISAPSGPAE